MYSIWLVLLFFTLMATSASSFFEQSSHLRPLEQLLLQQHRADQSKHNSDLVQSFEMEDKLHKKQEYSRNRNQYKPDKKAKRKKLRFQACNPPEVGKFDIMLALQQKRLGDNSCDQILKRMLFEIYASDSFARRPSIAKLCDTLVAQYRAHPCAIEQVEDLLNLLPIDTHLTERELLCSMLYGYKEKTSERPQQTHSKPLSRFITTSHLCKLLPNQTPKLNFHFAEPQVLAAIFRASDIESILDLREDKIKRDGVTLRRYIVTSTDLKKIGDEILRSELQQYKALFVFTSTRKPEARK